MVMCQATSGAACRKRLTTCNKGNTPDRIRICILIVKVVFCGLFEQQQKRFCEIQDICLIGFFYSQTALICMDFVVCQKWVKPE